MPDPTIEKFRTLKRIGRFVSRNWKYVAIGAAVVIGLAVAAYFGVRILF